MGADGVSGKRCVFRIAERAGKAYNPGKMSEALMRRKSWHTS
jgi:hypothetical protein